MSCLSCDAAESARSTAVTRALLCHVCPHGERPGHVWQGVTRCTVSGLPVAAHVRDGSCPEGLYSLANGRFWVGLPAPLRWLGLCLGAPRAAVRLIPGCGCVRVLKGAWLKIFQKSRRGSV